MKKNVNVAKVVIYVVMGLIGVSAIACIIISMITGKVTPYLAMGLGLGAIGNAIGFVTVYRQKGKDNGSGKDGSVS